MSKETELSDEQIDACIEGLGMSENSILAGPDEIRKAMRAVIAADRELRRGDDQDLAQLHANGAKAWADVPDATAWVDELRGNAPVQPVALPAGMPEPVASVYTMEALVPGGESKCHASLNQSLPSGTKLYTAAQVQAMLAAHVPVAAFDRLQSLADSQAAQLLAFDDAVERKPLSEAAISHCINMSIGLPDQHKELAQAVERQCAASWGIEITGITAQQGGAA